MAKTIKFMKYFTPIILAILFTVIAIFIVVRNVGANGDIAETKYIAHRGHGYYDNTIEAFYNSEDYWGIECDVRITSDNKLILNHDATVRYDDGTVLNVEESTYNELMSKTIGGGYYLCSLRKYLEICNEMDKVAIIELKSAFDVNDVTKLVDEIILYHSLEDSVVISFDRNNLLNVREQANIELHYLTGAIDGVIEFCAEYGMNVSMSHGIVTQDVVKKAHDNGIKIGVWTVNDALSNNKMKQYQVDYITSDVFCE